MTLATSRAAEGGWSGAFSGNRPAHTYRRDIDGLRALAVTLVIAYHALPTLLPGGFIGVDVFFVISGYLITQLILTGLQRRTFSLSGFYQRRVRRIVPALLVVLGACYALGWFVLLPGEFHWLGKSMSWSTPFLANLFFAKFTGYFDPGADYNLLLHLWSLAVEEQFYLVWPIFLMIAVRYGVTLRMLGAVIAASLAISVWGARYAAGVHFFLPGPRAWELAVGGLLAARQLGTSPPSVTDTYSPADRRRRCATTASSLSGLALLVAGALLLSADNALPGAWGAVPAGGAVLLIAAGPHSLVGRRLLSTAPLVFVGRLSYPLYLWHWPLFAFARGIWGRSLPAAGVSSVVVLAFAAAFATYRLVEVPIRYGAIGRRAVPALLAGLGAFTVLGAATAAERVAGRLPASAFAAWESVIRDWQVSGKRSVDPRTAMETIALRTQRASTALFIGDSHIMQYWPRVAYLIESHPQTARSALLVAYAGCPLLPGITSLRQPRDCDGFLAYATAQAWQPRVDTVVFGAFWEVYLLGEYQVQSRLGVYSSNDFSRIRLQLHSPATQIAFARFERLLAQLVAGGRRVFIVLSNPTSPQFDPPALVPPAVRLSLRAPGSFVADRSRSVDAAGWQAYVAPLMDRLRDIGARTGARVIEPRSSLCPGMVCPAVGSDGLPLYIDSSHLRAAYARQRARFIDETLLGPEAR